MSRIMGTLLLQRTSRAAWNSPITFLRRYSSSSSSSSHFRHYSSTTAEEGEDGVFATPGPQLTTADPCLLQPGVVLYDGVCHLCNSGVNWVIRVDKEKKIKFCAVQSRAAEPYLRFCGVDRKDVLRRFVFVEGPGLCHQASTAALKVASYLPLPYSTLSALLIIPTPLRDKVYDYIAAHRYQWFGKAEECIIPDDDVLDRFIDRHELVQRLHKQKDI